MLPAVRRDRRARFEQVIALPGTFDYHGLERGGHHAVLYWVLGKLPKPHAVISRVSTSQPNITKYHPSGWFAQKFAEDPPKTVGLMYTPDADISIMSSRLENPKTVICTRDIRNCIASRLKWHETKSLVFRIDTGFTHIWKMYARQILGDTTYLNGKTVGIVFDQWVSSEVYRRSVCAKLGELFGQELPDGENMSKVSTAGGGSSFDKMDYEGKAEQMQVTERWKEYADHPLMCKLCTDEVLELNARLINGAAI